MIIKINSNTLKGSNIDHPSVDLRDTYRELLFNDNGIGFDNNYREKVFEVCQKLHDKSRYDGTGITLSICKKIAENHNGFIVGFTRKCWNNI